MKSQGVLFSEPFCAETAVWCELNEGIDPAKWVGLCRHIGRLDETEFERISAILMPQLEHISGVKENGGIDIPHGPFGLSQRLNHRLKAVGSYQSFSHLINRCMVVSAKLPVPAYLLA